MCMGGSSPEAEEVYTPPEIENYEYELAEISIGDSTETAKKKKKQQEDTTKGRSNTDLII